MDVIHTSDADADDTSAKRGDEKASVSPEKHDRDDAHDDFLENWTMHVKSAEQAKFDASKATGPRVIIKNNDLGTNLFASDKTDANDNHHVFLRYSYGNCFWSLDPVGTDGKYVRIYNLYHQEYLFNKHHDAFTYISDEPHEDTEWELMNQNDGTWKIRNVVNDTYLYSAAHVRFENEWDREVRCWKDEIAKKRSNLWKITEVKLYGNDPKTFGNLSLDGSVIRDGYTFIRDYDPSKHV